MARPKSRDYESSAIFKIKNAYWNLLERKGFSEITMKMLAKEAGINRNSLYYHYANIQEIATDAFREIISDESSMMFIDMLLDSPKDLTGQWDLLQLSERIRKLHLYAKSDSPLLCSLLKESLIARWFQLVGIESRHLTQEDQLKMDYIANGFIGLLGNKSIALNPRLLAVFPESLVGKAAIQTIRELKK